MNDLVLSSIDAITIDELHGYLYLPDLDLKLEFSPSSISLKSSQHHILVALIIIIIIIQVK